MGRKGIFCIEGLWDSDLRDKSTVRPILDLLHSKEQIPFIYRDCATIAELRYLTGKWALKKYDAFPILYLAFHGEKSTICLGAERFSLDDFGELLNGRCRNDIIVFGSCSTLDIRKSRLTRFLNKTGALAVCGYRSDVEWLTATAFELMLMAAMQDNEFSGRGIASIRRKIQRYSGLAKELRFRMVTRFDG